MKTILLPLIASLGFGIAAAEGTAPPADAYPLTTCVVSGEALGSMGDPVVIEHEGKTVKFCCKSCIKRFNKDPAAYLSKLTAVETGKPAVETPKHDHGEHKH